MWNFQVFVFSLLCMYLFLFLGMSKVVDMPSPHSSRKQKKCGSCHSFLTDLDPHPDCSKCVPRGYSRESPCSHCAPLSQDAWKKWERQQCSKWSSSSTKGPRGIQLRGGGGTNLGRYAQMFLLPPKPNLPVGWDSRPWNRAFRPFRDSRDSSQRPTPQIPKPAGPVYKTGCSRQRDFSLTGTGGPLASQGPDAGCDLSGPSRVMEPSGTTSHTATTMDPVHGSHWSVSFTDTTLNCQARGGSNEQLRVWRYGGGVHGHGFNGLHGSTKPAHGRRAAALHSGDGWSGQTPAVRQAPPLHFRWN